MNGYKTRIGVIGSGWWASDYHIPGVLAHPEAELAAICDRDPERLAKASRAYPLPHVYLDYHQMLEREHLDGVIIATPHATHYRIAKDCLESGCHLLIEKPMTLTARDARDLLDQAGELKKEIVIGYTYHHLQHVQRARQAILGGQMGPVEYLSGSFCSDMTGFLGGQVSETNSPTRFTIQGPSAYYNQPEMLGGGQGHLQLTHLIGMMFFITGLRARKVQAQMNALGRKVDMVDAFNIEFDNGALGLIGGTGNARRNTRVALCIYCAEGCYLADTLGRLAFLRNADGIAENLEWVRVGKDGKETISRSPVTDNFIEVIRGTAENMSPGEIGWHAVEILDAAYRSVKEQGRIIQIEELYQ